MWRLLLCMCLLSVSACASPAPARTFVTGLSQPRGLTFDTEGNLFVAEAGAREPAEPGQEPADTNHSGRVLRIAPDRQMTVVADGLPYTYYSFAGDVGAADVAILDGELYALIGEGYDDELSRTVLHLPEGGPPQRVAYILGFAMGLSSSAEQQMGVVTSNPYAVAPGPDGALYVADGASGSILRITLDGQIRIFAELPKMPLTGLAWGPDGRLYAAMFSLRPHAPGSGQVWAAAPSGELALVAEDLTMPIDVAFDAAGDLLVLEFGAGSQPDHPYAAESGRLLRIGAGGQRTVLLDRLDYPTAMAFSPVGDLYIATGGAFTAAGAILRVPCHRLGACPQPPTQ